MRPSKSKNLSCGACAAAAVVVAAVMATETTGVAYAAPSTPTGFLLPSPSFFGSSATSPTSGSSGRRRIHASGLQERCTIEGGGGGGGGGMQLARRRPRTATMLVDTDVKTILQSKEADIASSSSDSKTAATSKEGTGPPPIPVDNFRHKSLKDVPTDYGPYLTIKGFKINFFGFFFMVVTLTWAIPWAILLLLQKATIEYMDKVDPRRFNVDRGSALWGWLSSLTTDSLPEVTGVENIPEGPAVRCLCGRCGRSVSVVPLSSRSMTSPPPPHQPQPQVYVANHASWMDVLYSAQLPVRTKYLAKADLAKVPILGDAMSLAQHVLLDRDDKRSQMQALRSSLLILKTGTPIFVFPEGTRGPAGRLQSFKMGAFKVATKAGVPIIPVSIAGTHIMMPKEVIMPQVAGRGITAIHVHPPISSQGRTDQELADLAFDIINNALSDEQRCLPSTKKEDTQGPAI